ncbi:hypothetical protein CRG98_048616, partial [Punica granatum]
MASVICSLPSLSHNRISIRFFSADQPRLGLSLRTGGV